MRVLDQTESESVLFKENTGKINGFFNAEIVWYETSLSANRRVAACTNYVSWNKIYGPIINQNVRMKTVGPFIPNILPVIADDFQGKEKLFAELILSTEKEMDRCINWTKHNFMQPFPLIATTSESYISYFQSISFILCLYLYRA